MLIARIVDGSVAEIADYRAMFPQTSFSADGPTDEFLTENSCLRVSMSKPHDRATQVQEQSAPYIEGQWVYTVTVRDLTAEELAAKLDEAKAQRITAINAEAQNRITARWPLWAQSNVALGVYSEPEAQACRDWIADHITASNTACDAVAAATTAAAVAAVAVNWPAV